MKYDMNVLKEFSYGKRYILTHPWILVRQAWRNLCNAWQRATKGYCKADAYNMDAYLLAIMPQMLEDLRDDPCGAYPGNDEFPTPESWETWLTNMANTLRELQDDWAESRNEYEKTYFKAMHEYHTVSFKNDDGTTVVCSTYNDDDIKELHDKWLARIEELNKQQQELTIKTFTEIGRHLYQLWS